MELIIFTSVCLICITWAVTTVMKLDHQKKQLGIRSGLINCFFDRIINALNEISSDFQSGDKQNPETDEKN